MHVGLLPVVQEFSSHAKSFPLPYTSCQLAAESNLKWAKVCSNANDLSWGPALGRDSLTQRYQPDRLRKAEARARQINDANWQTSRRQTASLSLNKLPAGDIFRRAFRRDVRWDCIRRALCLPPSIVALEREKETSFPDSAAHVQPLWSLEMLGAENDAVARWVSHGKARQVNRQVFSLLTRREGGRWLAPLVCSSLSSLAPPMRSFLLCFVSIPSALCARSPRGSHFYFFYFTLHLFVSICLPASRLIHLLLCSSLAKLAQFCLFFAGPVKRSIFF